MPRARQLKTLVLNDDARLELQAIANSRSMLHSIVKRTKIVFAYAVGQQNKTVPERFGNGMMMRGKWSQRYLHKGVSGLHDEIRPGRPHNHNDKEVANVINLVSQTKPDDGSTHWSTRTVAEERRISKSTVQR